MQIEKILFALLRYTVCGETVEDELKNQITPELLPDLYKLADKHDMAHILSKTLWDLGISGADTTNQLRQKQMMAVYRYEKLSAAYAEICQYFEKIKIPFLPLKGSVIRQYYPEPWMRTSCDIDVLVREEDLEVAATFLEENLHYKKGIKGTHDMSIYTPTGVHLELHYRMVEERSSREREDALLNDIWQYVSPETEGKFQHRMTDEMFLFYHVSHMAKHFDHGGCGIKPLMDLWLLEHKAGITVNKAADLLEQGGLLKFAHCARELAEVWFSGKEATAVTEQMESYILFGGVYGNTQKSAAVSRRKKSKWQYLMSKVFIPWKTLRHYYPVLHKHRWLTPWCNVQRWFRLVFTKDAKHSMHVIKSNAAVDNEKINTVAALFEQVGLS